MLISALCVPEWAYLSEPRDGIGPVIMGCPNSGGGEISDVETGQRQVRWGWLASFLCH